MKRWVVLLLVLGSTMAIAQERALFGSAECQTTEGMVGLRHTVEVEASDSGSVARLDLALTASPLPEMTFAPLVFADTVQIDSGASETIACGESATFHYELPEGVHALNVLLQRVPLVPAFIDEASYDRVASELSRPTRNVTLRFTGINNQVIAPLSEDEIERRRTELALPEAQVLAFDDLRDTYLFTPPNWEEPTAAVRLGANEDTYTFGVFYQSGSRDGRDATITCLLDGRQVAAFGGALAWGGTLEFAQAVRIEGSVEIAEPGWHHLRCVLLNSVASNDEDPAPDVISSTFVYKEP